MNRRVSDALQPSKSDHSVDTYNSLRPLTWLLNLFAINSNVIKNIPSNFFSVSKYVVVFVVLGSISVFSMLYKNIYFYKKANIAPSIMLTDTVQTVYDLIQYFVDLWFVHKYGRHISIEYFKQYENIDSILGMTHHAKFKWTLIKLLSIFTLIWLSTSVCDYLAWFFSYGWISPSVYIIAYIFFYIKMLTTMDFSSHMLQIRFRLNIIGDIVDEYYSVTEPLAGFMGNYVPNQEILRGRIIKDLKIEKKVKRLRSSNESEEINVLTRCYLQLTEQVEFINCMFGLRILLNSLSLLIDMIRFTNIAVRILLGTQQVTNELKYFPAACSMLRQISCVLVLINLVTQAEKVYRQSNRIIRTIDHLLIYKNPTDKLRNSIIKLRDLMRSRPINFNLANFFRLDNSLLASIASVTVTYTIILLQSMN